MGIEHVLEVSADVLGQEAQDEVAAPAPDA